jgi:hypothetical protein
MSRVNQIRPSESRREADREIDRSSSDDTVVEDDVDRPRDRDGQEGSNEKGRDPNLVDWYGEDDQENPYVFA